MPRIRDAFLDCVLYLYASEPDAEQGTRTGGSGFIVGVPATDLPGVWFMYAVTNRHVVEHGNTVLRMKTIDNQNSIMSTDERAWVSHPSGDDIAVCFIDFDRTKHKYSWASPDMFMTDELVKSYNIGPGDEAFIVGRFINHEGKQQNLPTVRFGCLAQMPVEPIRQEDGFEQESFLVEARSIGGYSGSPVFLYIPGGSYREGVADWNLPHLSKGEKWEKDKVYGWTISHGPWLLGVDWGHINDWDAVRDAAGRPINPANPRNMQVRLNTGMMAVVPAWKLAEMLTSGPIADERQRITEELRKEPWAQNLAATSD
jgi:hypothetical protein